MYSSVLQAPKNVLREPFDATELGEGAGLSFIYLNHKLGRGNSMITTFGFQGAYVYENKQGLEYKLTKDQDGNDCAAPTPLFWTPTGKLKKLSAAIPDTEYNRDVLAQAYYRGKSGHANSGGCWNFVDKNIEKAIEEIASVKYPRLEKTTMNLTETNAQEVIMLRALLNKKEKELEMAREATKSVINPRDRDKLRIVAKERVHLQHKELIEQIKEKSGDNYHLSKKYRSSILPLIDAEIDVIIKERSQNK